MNPSPRLPAFFIPHGAGPCFFMDWPGQADMWRKMADFLAHLGSHVQARPKAILVISAHWIEPEFSVTESLRPPLIYDYSGFPEYTYRLTYPAPGSPPLAHRVRDLLEGAGFAAKGNAERGLDHGVFIPFKLIYPDADIPIVQLSLEKHLDPAAHIRAGEALQALREEGVLIVGSGMSFHNMRGFNADFTDASKRFDHWLSEAVAQTNPALRKHLLELWEEAPDAHFTQPYPDHLLPLMVVAGAAGDDVGRRIFDDQVMHVIISGYAFG